MNANFIDDVILPLEVLNGLSIDSSILETDGTWRSSLIEYNLVDALGQMKVELRLVLVIELCVYLLC